MCLEGRIKLVDIRSYERIYLCHEYNEKKRCSECGSLNTKKNGFIYSKILTIRGRQKRKTQRFYCKDCKTSFTYFGKNVRKPISYDLQRRAVLDYVFTKNSLQEVANRYSISKAIILDWLIKISDDFQEIEDNIIVSKCSGVIQLDGKEIKVKGKKKTVLISIDGQTKQPLMYRLSDSENKLSSKEFLERLKEKYPVEIKGIISDFGKGKCFIGVVDEVFPEIPHQICLVHYLRYVWLFIPRTKRSKYYLRNQLLKSLIKKIIMASNREESIYWLNKFNHFKPYFRASYHKRFIRSINRNYSKLTMYYEYDYLNTNTNIIENSIRQLERKLKNLDGFKSEKNLESFLRIWFSGQHEKFIN